MLRAPRHRLLSSRLPLPHQLVLLAACFGFLLGHFSHLLFDISDLPLQTFVLLLLTVFTAETLVSFFCQLLHVLLQTSHQVLTKQTRFKSLDVFLTNIKTSNDSVLLTKLHVILSKLKSLESLNIKTLLYRELNVT